MTQLVTQQSKELSELMAGFSFGHENAIASDIRLPRILLMQGLSKMVSDPDVGARAGEFRDSTDGALLGDTKKPIRFIPYYFTNTFTVKRLVNGKWEFDSIQERTSANPRIDEMTGADGITRRYFRTMNIMGLIKGVSLTRPYILSLQSESFKTAANAFNNIRTKLASDGIQYPAVEWVIASEMTSNDKGTFAVSHLDVVKTTEGKLVFNTSEEVQAAISAYKQITSALKGGAKIATEETDHEESGENERF